MSTQTIRTAAGSTVHALAHVSPEFGTITACNRTIPTAKVIDAKGAAVTCKRCGA